MITALEVSRARNRTRAVLITGQVLSGLGMGSVLSVGALLVAEVANSPALSGMAATMITVGTALAAMPLAALAARKGRAPALTTGALIAAFGAVLGIIAAIVAGLALLLIAITLVGVGSAVNLQARFAATDLSEPRSRGRDISLVVWATTIGAVAGPNLIAPGDLLGIGVGLPPLSGPFLFTIVAQLAAAVLYFWGLRPDPLHLANSLSKQEASTAHVAVSTHDPVGVRTGVIATAFSHATMVAIMSMTPVHLVEQGATLVIVGLTISLHVAGMFALSPIFGMLSDRFGTVPIIGFGQATLVAALLTTSFGAQSEAAVVVGLILLGLGWSASTVAGTTLIAQSVDPLTRTRTQGRADMIMSAVGAAGGAVAGPILTWIGYNGLSLAALILVAGVLSALAWRVLTQRGGGGPAEEPAPGG